MKHYTAEDVLRLAKAELVGQTIMTDDNLSAMLFNKKHVADLINAAVEAEREACAALCDDTKDVYKNMDDAISITAGSLAKAIRARGGKE